MVWISGSDEEGAAIEELAALPDRAAAIVAAALLDGRIEFAIRRILRNAPLSGKETVHSRNFGPGAPFGSFSTKIDLGFMLGLYSAEARQDMAVINRVRNLFAHELAATSFAHQSVKDQCGNLKKFAEHYFEYGKVMDKNAISPAVAEPELQEHLKDPRHRFMMAVRLYYSALMMPASPPGI